ncbi:MAG TPA: hypothetical protein VM554_07210 [Acidisarcina sp.]|nr:hypothetical protein [Acidisarcina sp.]
MNRLLAFAVFLLPMAALGEKSASPVPQGTRATVIRETVVYISSDTSAQKVGQMTPGREMVIVEHSGKWLRVFANTDVEEARDADVPLFGQESAPPPVSGWVQDKGVLTAETPNGDAILLGEAATKELLASEPHSPPRAALDARLLYRRVNDFYPQSALAPEAAWRAADIRWQLEKADAMSRPSAHEKENYLREQLDDEELKKIEKKYPHSKWSDMAAFLQIDNKLCGDWQGSPKCPEKESETYEKYVTEHPDSPKAAEALYSAMYRQSVLVDIYAANEDRKKSDGAKAKARDLAGKLVSHWPQTDYAARAAALVYKLEQDIPIYGIDRE